MPGPPFKKPYFYFRWDATRDIETNRVRWTKGQIANTITTIWSGHPTIKAHYADCAGSNPGPQLPDPNPIPSQPYSAGDARVAKGGNILPNRSPVIAAAQGNADIPVESEQANKLPYDFWPKLPWAPMPDLPDLDMKMAHDPVIQRQWLAASPHRASDSENSWSGVCFLGAGGCGAAGLWVELDEAGNISDTMVIKDVKHYDPRYWRDPRNWRNLLPRELENHRLVEERRQVEANTCRYLAHSRGHRLLMTQRRYRIYLDNYNMGSILDRLDTADDGTLVPESFIWYLLKALSSACLLLQTGTVVDEPLPEWKPITHLDVQLQNVFLQSNKRKHGSREKEQDRSTTQVRLANKRRKVQPSAYAEDNGSDGTRVKGTEWSFADWDNFPVQPVLADFDCAFYSLDDGNCPVSDNPEDFIYYQNITRYPPEQQQQWGPPWIRLNGKTDVWSIGSVIYALIARSNIELGPVREDTVVRDVPLSSHQHPENEEPHDMFTVLSGNFYPASLNRSAEINDLVKSCLEWNQDNRPTLRHLLETAETQLRKPGVKTELMDWEGFELPNDAELFELGVPAQDALDALDGVD